MILEKQFIAYSDKPNANRVLYVPETLQKIAEHINTHATEKLGCVTNQFPEYNGMVYPSTVIGRPLNAKVTEDGQLFCDIELSDEAYSTAQFTLAGMGKTWQAESYYTIMPEDYEFLCLVAVANSSFTGKGESEYGNDAASI